ncbi:MAG: phage replisome organizer N-terminal domain-containing protein [Anaeromicrobium sp.]|jgi:predicted phage replisome organizer|uniref:phage replisome organizer N-terminal domain-containing protein n=1 Tax=Anaeromicrobium sp. TaxID=1929132 RepID=UPI0025D62827|nr:phage replisome organizer N-terminal domain-containing protein [Anaeromicrobium sp.]MCT4593149.1 phage replisome organizer N-terminal domain-containing protein [Anaeromicrobium sp.]
MTKAKRYYWLKLHDNFFDREEIKLVENMTNGKDYIIFYLKLLLKSIKTEGELRFRNVIPYTPEMLASITGINIDTVRVATDLFINLQLMEKWDDGTLFMAETQAMIGSETESAKRMRRKREKDQKLLASQCDEDVQKSDTEIELEKEIDIDINNSVEDSDEPSSHSDEKIKYDEKSTYYKAAIYLREKILEFNPKCRVPKDTLKDLQKWSNDMRLIFEKDNRTREEVYRIIQFIFDEDDFWSTVVQSPSGLRKNWDKIMAQMIAKEKKKDRVEVNKPKGNNNRFHNFKQRTDKYSAEELEKLVRNRGKNKDEP